MANMSVRNIPDEDFAALKRIAASNNRSVEAEVRRAISNLVRAHAGEGLGTILHGKYGGLMEQDFDFTEYREAHQPMAME